MTKQREHTTCCQCQSARTAAYQAPAQQRQCRTAAARVGVRHHPLQPYLCKRVCGNRKRGSGGKECANRAGVHSNRNSIVSGSKGSEPCACLKLAALHPPMSEPAVHSQPLNTHTHAPVQLAPRPRPSCPRWRFRPLLLQPPLAVTTPSQRRRLRWRGRRRQ